jgi:hypothetical protein
LDPSEIRAITQFVRGTLGCNCPDEVFETMTISPDQQLETGATYTRLLVGQRLLIYVLNAARGTQISTTVSSLTTRGCAERDAGDLNRFRLVLATAHPTRIVAEAQTSFDAAAGCGDRSHLHVIASDQLPDPLRQA